MDISQYLAIHRFAIEKQFEIVVDYQNRLKVSIVEARRANNTAEDRSVEHVAAEADPDEIFTERDLRVRYQIMLQANHQSLQYQQKLQEIEQHMSGINQVCGLILQSAKQCISTVHRDAGWGRGRNVGSSEPLGNVIRQARNQAFHYEEGTPIPKVVSCFNNLHADFGIPNDLSLNLARFVVFDVLEWSTYANYEADMSENF